MKYMIKRTITYPNGATHKAYLSSLSPAIIYTIKPSEAKPYSTKTQANEDIKLLRKNRHKTIKEAYEVVER